MPAPGGWFTCEVVRTGPAEDGTVFIMLRDLGGAFGPGWYPAVDAMKREMLATALAAISTGFHVDVSLSSTDEYAGRVNRMYVTRG